MAEPGTALALCNDEYHFKILDVCNIDKQYARIPEDSTTFDFFTISETKMSEIGNAT